MTFLWKDYLAKLEIPNVLFSSHLKSELIKLLCYDESSDTFKKVTSPYLPQVVAFTEYWKNDVSLTDNDSDELEIEELLSLLRASNRKSFGGATAGTFHSLIQHFYPEVSIEEDKYIHGVVSNRWNKKEQIEDFLTIFRNRLGVKHQDNPVPVPVFEAYEQYANHMRTKQPMVSKRYFERYVSEQYAEFFDTDGCLSAEWYASVYE